MSSTPKSANPQRVICDQVAKACSGIKNLQWLRDAMLAGGWCPRKDRPTKIEMRDEVRRLLADLEPIVLDCAAECGEHILDKFLAVQERNKVGA